MLEGYMHGYGVFRIRIAPEDDDNDEGRNEIYEGQFKEDVIYGYGIYRYLSGSVYEGQWV